MKSERFLASYPRKRKTFCSVKDCKKQVASHGLCNVHWKRFERRGTTDKFERTRKDYVDERGYIRRYVDGCRQGQLVHRLVMHEILGRSLFPGETVHHKNGIKSDNSSGNLELRISLHPRGSSVKEMLEFANLIIGRYAKP